MKMFEYQHGQYVNLDQVKRVHKNLRGSLVLSLADRDEVRIADPRRQAEVRQIIAEHRIGKSFAEAQEDKDTETDQAN